MIIAGWGSAIHAQAEQAPPEVQQENPIEIAVWTPMDDISPESGEVYRRNVLPMKIHIRHLFPLRAVYINGDETPLAANPTPDSKGQFSTTLIEKRLALFNGRNEIRILVHDIKGNAQSVAQVQQIKADFLLWESPESMMPLAIVSFIRDPDTSPKQDVVLLRELEVQLLKTKRFRVVDRTEIDKVLTEQSANIDSEQVALQFGRNVAAHAFVIAEAVSKDGGLELVAKVVSTESGSVISYVDEFVSDASDMAQVDKAVESLARRIADLCPRITGKVIAAQGNDLAVDFRKSDGIREGMYFIILKEISEAMVDESTGEIILPAEIGIIGRGVITQVTDTGSRCKILSSDEPIEKDMPVLTW